VKLKQGYLSDFVSLLFPQLCPACGESLVAGEQIICTDCRYTLPFTNFHLQPENIVARQFWGRLKLQGAYALYYFTKEGKVQSLVHHLKYKGMPQIGNLLGNMAGNQLVKSAVFNSVDIIIPVPLHTNRLKERGYNQSTCFAQGLAQKLRAIVDDDSLVRVKVTETQTRKKRYSRFENMQEVFMVKHPERLKNKHILLVDDVMTTGATLDACGEQLLKIEGLKLSIAAIAYVD